MKKILALILTLSISLGFAFAQDAKAEEVASNGKYLGFIKDMRAGAFFNFEPAAGGLHEFVFSTIGGGASFEAGVPLTTYEDETFINNILNNFGLSFRMAFDGGLMKETNITSLFSMRYMAGVYTRIPLPGDMFSIVPEIGYGIVFNFPKATGDGAQYVKKLYVDQVLQFGAGVRFSHPQMVNGNLEFEFTPTYTLSPEFVSPVHYIGFRLGASYKFADKKNVSSETKSNKAVDAKDTPAEEHLQPAPEVIQRKNELNQRPEELREKFENLALDAEENNLKKLAKKYRSMEKQIEKILDEISLMESEEEIEAKLAQLDEELESMEAVEHEAEVELDIAVTDMAAKTGHAALIHHPDGSYTIAIPPLTFEANTTGLVINEQNKKSLDTLIEVLTTDERIEGMIVSVYGFINPDSGSDHWTEEEKILAKGRAETIAGYLSENGCNHRVDSHAGEGYTTNAVFNRRVEFLLHS